MRIYLDHNATTPLRPEARSAMEEVLRDGFGNPSSVTFEGARARARVEEARANVARLVSVSPAAVRFTSGATEANNTLLLGRLAPGDRVVTTRIEHPSVSAPLEAMAKRGVEVEALAPDAAGRVPLEAFVAAIDASTRLVAVIWANNETGAIQPIEDLARLCRERGVWLHVDATQALGKLPIDLERVPVDSLACSAHKLGGPKGVGALIARDQAAIPPIFLGGGQERGQRGGTENTVGIAGFGAACAAAADEPAKTEIRVLRDRLWAGIRANVSDIRWNGEPETTLPNTLNCSFEGVAGEVLLQALDLEGVAVSAGAACHSGSVEPSKTLLAMGRTPAEARSSLRFSLGQGVDTAQIDRTIELLAKLVPRVRALGEP